MYSTFLSYFIFTFYLFFMLGNDCFFLLGQKIVFLIWTWFLLLLVRQLVARNSPLAPVAPLRCMLQMKPWWNIHRRCNISPLYDLNLFWQLALLGFVMRLRRFNKISLLFDRFCNLHSTLFGLCCCTTREIKENRKCKILWNMQKFWLNSSLNKL